jgi:hypothetical protein
MTMEPGYVPIHARHARKARGVGPHTLKEPVTTGFSPLMWGGPRKRAVKLPTLWGNFS